MERHYLARSPESDRIIKVVEVSGDLGDEANQRRATKRAQGAMVVLDPTWKAEDYFSFNPLDAPGGADGDEAHASGASR